MSGKRVTVDRDLYISALSDAINWTVSLIQAGNPNSADRGQLARYRQAYTRIVGQQHDPPYDGPVVTLDELSARYRA